MNGDGFSDVIVGAYLYDNGQTDEGRAFVYLGSAAGLAPTAAWTAEAIRPALFGFSVATAGDVNGDGFSDVIVGAYFYDNGRQRGAGLRLLTATAWPRRPRPHPRQARTDDALRSRSSGRSDSESAFRLKVLGRTRPDAATSSSSSR